MPHHGLGLTAAVENVSRRCRTVSSARAAPSHSTAALPCRAVRPREAALHQAARTQNTRRSVRFNAP